MNFNEIKILRFQYQKKNGFFSYEVQKPLTESFRIQFPIGVMHFSFQDGIFTLFCEEFLDYQEVSLDFFMLEFFIPKIEQFKDFLHQGYNNWTQTFEVPIKSSQMNVNFFFRWLFGSFGEYTIIKYIKKFNKAFLRSHFYTYLRSSDNKILLFASLDEKNAYTIFQLDYKNSILKVIKDYQNYYFSKSFLLMNLLIKHGNYYEVFNDFSERLDAISETNITGYTSWYYHYNKIDFETLESRLDFFGKEKIPIDYFQIDDGYQERVGDWLNLKPSFRGKIKSLVEKAKSYNIKPGIWIAPFICEKKSNLFYYHEDWLLRDENEKPVIAGFNPLWSGWFYSINIYHHGFQDYLNQVLQTFVKDWGFELLKLDFLYASSIYPVKRKTRAIQMQDALSLIHKIVNWRKSNVKLLGCGIPFSHTFGNVNFARVGSDVEEKWDNYLKNFHFLERVSTFSSLNSTIHRHPFNGKNFLSDPDVFYLRESFRSLKSKDISKKIGLTIEERLTLLYVNYIFGGLVFTSDPVETYDPEKLELYKKLFPFSKKEYKTFKVVDEHSFEVHFSIKKQNFFTDSNQKEFQLEYLFLVNLSDKKVKFFLEPNVLYFVAFPFQKKFNLFIKSQETIILPPHNSLLLYKTQIRKSDLLGSNGHIFPLSEISSYSKRKKKFKFKLEKEAFQKTKVFVHAKDVQNSSHAVKKFENIPYYEIEVINQKEV